MSTLVLMSCRIQCRPTPPVAPRTTTLGFPGRDGTPITSVAVWVGTSVACCVVGGASVANGLGCCCFSPAPSKSPLRREEKSSEHVAGMGARLVAVDGLGHNANDDASDRRATASVVSQWRPRRRRSTRLCGNLIIPTLEPVRRCAPVVSQWRPRRMRSTSLCGNLIISSHYPHMRRAGTSLE